MPERGPGSPPLAVQIPSLCTGSQSPSLPSSLWWLGMYPLYSCKHTLCNSCGCTLAYLCKPIQYSTKILLGANHSLAHRLLPSADHSFMCVPPSLLACACLCDAIDHMAPAYLIKCMEMLAQLAGLDHVRELLVRVCKAATHRAMSFPLLLTGVTLWSNYEWELLKVVIT